MPKSLLTRLPRYGDGDGKAIGSVQFIDSFEFVEESLGSVGFLESIGSAQSVGFVARFSWFGHRNSSLCRYLAGPGLVLLIPTD